MVFETVVVGPLGVNCCIIGCEKTGEAIIVDPGGDVSRILQAVERRGLKVRTIVNTHGHFDHVGGNAEIKATTGAELLIHEADAQYLPRAAQVATMYGLSVEPSPPADRYIGDGDTVTVGEIVLRIIHTPGHTPGCICLYHEPSSLIVTGDTLFHEGVGRTDLPGGSTETILQSINGKLMKLPAETVAWPGHGPSTTIGHEKTHNPYLGGGW